MTRFRALPAFVAITFSLNLFSQSDTEIKPASVSLPEVLLSFDAVMNAGRVELTWSSNTELNNHHFTVERSKDARDFTEFLTIRNFGNNSNLISYFDVDYAPFQGISYYRLTQTNAEGYTLSSRLVSVDNHGMNEVLSLADSGDATDSSAADAETHEEIVVLRDEKGEERMSKVIVDANDELRMSSDISPKLDNGTYVIIAASDNKLYSKVIKIMQ